MDLAVFLLCLFLIVIRAYPRSPMAYHCVFIYPCAEQEARTNYRNFRDLLWNLIFKKHWNDLEKAR